MARLSTRQVTTTKDHDSATQTTTATSMASTQFSSVDFVTNIKPAQPTTTQNSAYVTGIGNETSTTFLSKPRTNNDRLLQKVEDQCSAFTNEVQNDCKIKVTVLVR